MVKNYMLNQNALYIFRLPISILISIFIFNFIIRKKKIKNSYMLQIIIPFSILIITYLIITLISYLMISNDEEKKLINICKKIGYIENYSITNEPPVILDNETINKNDTNISALNTNINKLNTDLTNTENTENEEFNNSYGCLFKGSNGNLCSGIDNPKDLFAPIPGPQWMPQSAESVQNRLKNQDYTPSTCPL